MGGSSLSQKEPTSAGAVLSAEELRMERSIALIRIAVVVVVGGVYLSSIGIRRTLGPLAISILTFAAVYCLWSLLARPYENMTPARFRAATLLADAALITLWCQATGGPESEFWTLYLIAVIAMAMRVDLIETLGAALGLSLLYVAAMSIDGGLPTSSLLLRPPLMLITGFAVGILAHQRRIHQEQREALSLLAEERRRALVEGQELVARLQQVDLARTEFVAVAAHEFRTPLTAVLGVMGTLRSHGDQIDRDIRMELLDGASSQVRRLARLVDDLLTVSRVEDGALRLDVQPEEPERLILEAAQASGSADRIGIDLGGVERVPCDADRIVRVLTNLLDNARKYSPPDAPIFVSVGQDDQNVWFSVRDQGPGIPGEDLERVFERFRRLLDRPDRPGAGLGLYICRCLVESHGGSIEAREAPAGGAEFVFSLPKARPLGETRPAEPMASHAHVS